MPTSRPIAVHERRTPESDGRRWPVHLAIVKIAKVPFWFIWLTPFFFGYLASAGSTPRHVVWAVLFAIGVCLGDAACNFHNELVDREEDAVNQPNRTRLLAAVDDRILWKLVFGGYGMCVVGFVLLAVFVGLDVAAFAIVMAVAAVLYNCGPRLKRRPIAAKLTIGLVSLSMFLAGWSWHEPVSNMPVVAWLLAYFVTATVFLKDLPDAEGDELVNAPGLFNVKSASLRRLALAFIYLSPYGMAAGLVIAGSLPNRVLGVGVLLPAAVLLVFVAERPTSLVQEIAAYQLAFIYIHVFSLTLFLLYVFTSTAAMVVTLLFVARIIVLRVGLDPRLVEPDFSWSASIRSIVGTRGPKPVVADVSIDLRDPSVESLSEPRSRGHLVSPPRP